MNPATFASAEEGGVAVAGHARVVEPQRAEVVHGVGVAVDAGETVAPSRGDLVGEVPQQPLAEGAGLGLVLAVASVEGHHAEVEPLAFGRLSGGGPPDHHRDGGEELGLVDGLAGGAVGLGLLQEARRVEGAVLHQPRRVDLGLVGRGGERGGLGGHRLARLAGVLAGEHPVVHRHHDQQHPQHCRQQLDEGRQVLDRLHGERPPRPACRLWGALRAAAAIVPPAPRLVRPQPPPAGRRGYLGESLGARGCSTPRAGRAGPLTYDTAPWPGEGHKRGGGITAPAGGRPPAGGGRSRPSRPAPAAAP